MQREKLRGDLHRVDFGRCGANAIAGTVDRVPAGGVTISAAVVISGKAGTDQAVATAGSLTIGSSLKETVRNDV